MDIGWIRLNRNQMKEDGGLGTLFLDLIVNGVGSTQ
jgi:hypothetical protein